MRRNRRRRGEEVFMAEELLPLLVPLVRAPQGSGSGFCGVLPGERWTSDLNQQSSSGSPEEQVEKRQRGAAVVSALLPLRCSPLLCHTSAASLHQLFDSQVSSSVSCHHFGFFCPSTGMAPLWGALCFICTLFLCF